MKKFDTLIRVIVTEKSATQQEKGKYTFAVKKSATKTDVKQAVREFYGVEVKNVKMMVAPKKTKLIKRGKEVVKRPVTKKAVVTLKGKKTMDVNKIIDSKKK